MLLSSRVAIGAAVLLCVGATQAQAPVQKKLPTVVRQALAEMAKSCREVGGKPMPAPDLLQVADLTGDGLPDFVIDQGAFDCQGAASLFSGTGGSGMSAYVGTPDGQATEAFSSYTFGVRIDRQARPARLHVVVGGKLCGQRVPAGMAHSDEKSCWRPVDWHAGRRTMQFAPVSKVEFIQ